MSQHDTWVFLKYPSPYDQIKPSFPHGFPMRDPFGMKLTSGADGERVILWVVDLDRLDNFQFNLIAEVIAIGCGANIEEVIDEAFAVGGFNISDEWISRMEVGPEGYQRTMELKEFLETAPQPPDQGAWIRFLNSQLSRWVEGDEIPPPMPSSIDEIDPNLRTPELEQAMQANRINRLLATGGYSVMDVLSGRAMVDVLNAQETDPQVSWSLVGDTEDEEF